MSDRKFRVLPDPGPSLLRVYSRNLELLMTKRGWSPVQLAQRLGITQNTLNRIRLNRSRYIDPEVLEGCIRLFNCTPNDLLATHSDIDYADAD